MTEDPGLNRQSSAMLGCGSGQCIMRIIRLFTWLVFNVSAGLAGIQLQPVTVQAWEKYIDSVDQRAESRAHGGSPFLWADEQPDRRVRLQQGEVLVMPMVGRGMTAVPEGLIHDWIGAVYLPEMRLPRLMQFFGNYNNYSESFKPFVVKSRLLSCSSSDAEFAMTWQHNVLFVKAAIQAHFHTRYFMIDQQHGYSIGGSNEISEIANLGNKNEHVTAPDAGHGYVWRLHSVTRYQQSENGVYLEIETLALTRAIPGSLHWLIAPVITRLSVNSLMTMLRQTREALTHDADTSLPVCTPCGFGIVSAISANVPCHA